MCGGKRRLRVDELNRAVSKGGCSLRIMSATIRLGTFSMFTRLFALFGEFLNAERKTLWFYDQCRWRYFGYRKRKQDRINVLFDQRHGVETATEIQLEAVGVAFADAARGNNVYRPLTEDVFRSAMASLPIDLQDFTFVDIGSGKGKAMLLASNLPFRRIVGVEYAQRLHTAAQQNIARYQSTEQRCNNIESVFGDALTCTLPEGPLLVFFFNSLAIAVMRQMLERLDVLAVAAPGRAMFVVYTNIRHVKEMGDVFDGLSFIHPVRTSKKYIVLANAAAGGLLRVSNS